MLPVIKLRPNENYLSILYPMYADCFDSELKKYRYENYVEKEDDSDPENRICILIFAYSYVICRNNDRYLVID